MCVEFSCCCQSSVSLPSSSQRRIFEDRRKQVLMRSPSAKSGCSRREGETRAEGKMPFHWSTAAAQLCPPRPQSTAGWAQSTVLVTRGLSRQSTLGCQEQARRSQQSVPLQRRPAAAGHRRAASRWPAALVLAALSVRAEPSAWCHGMRPAKA